MPRKKQMTKTEVEGPEELLSLEQAAAALRISRSTLTRSLTQGRIRGFKVGRQWRFRRVDLDKFSQMSHPSAASVNVSEIETIIEQLSKGLLEDGEITLTSSLAGYPATEEEKTIVQLFQTLIAGGIRANASDIHIDATREGTIIRQRVDGVLHELVRLPQSAHKALIACIKTFAGLMVEQQQMPQDGIFHTNYKNIGYTVRVAVIPATFGETMVMRILAQVYQTMNLDQLPMTPEDKARFIFLITRPSGFVIVSGPTGSGKSTTMYAALQYIANPERKIYSIEDPVEIAAFPWMTQIGVNKKAGLTFETALRSLMRQDPDVIMVGGINTLEVGELCAQAALTGHLVLSTLHAGTATRAITRLLDMGIEPFMISETLICSVAIRIVRQVCPDCVQPDQPAFHLLAQLSERARAGGYKLPENPNFQRGDGCDKCRHTGYHGRTAIFEVMEIDQDLQRLIASRASTEEIQAEAVKKGMTTLAADGLRKAAEGITTVVEVMRVLPQE